MAKALQRKPAKRGGNKRGTKPHRKPARAVGPIADFCAAARDALKRGHDVSPFEPQTVTATETVVAACGMIRAADLNMFDVAIWFHRPQGIE